MNNRVYCYVDGSYVIRSLGRYISKKFRSDFPPPVVFTLISNILDLGLRKSQFLENSDWRRSHWFGSFTGSDEELQRNTRKLKDEGFDTFLFRKEKHGSEKQVDTQLVTKLLTDSFNKLFDLAVVVTGDLDYLNAIKEVRRNGQDVVVVGFMDSSNHELIYEADQYVSIDLVLNNHKDRNTIKFSLDKLDEELRENLRYLDKTKKS